MAEEFVYDGLKYSSKAECIRDLYDKGFITMQPASKKQWAVTLAVSVPTIHATIVKHTTGSTKKETKLQKIKEGPTPVHVNTKGLFAIIEAPNPWGLPVINPPLMINPKTEPRMKTETEFQLF